MDHDFTGVIAPRFCTISIESIVNYKVGTMYRLLVTVRDATEHLMEARLPAQLGPCLRYLLNAGYGLKGE